MNKCPNRRTTVIELVNKINTRHSFEGRYIDKFFGPFIPKNFKNSLYLYLRTIYRQAVLQEMDMSTCNGPEVSCLLVTHDFNKLM
jgi:hypothetical protein